MISQKLICCNVDEGCSVLKNAIIKVSRNLCMSRAFTSGRGYRNNKPWFDDTCIAYKKNLKGALKECKLKGFDSITTDTFIKARKQYQNTIQIAKEDYWSKFKQDISSCNNPNSFWIAIRKFTNSNKHSGRCSELDIIVTTDYFRGMFDCFSAGILELDLGQFDPVLDATISADELELVLNRVKKNKSPGPDNIPNEFFKFLDASNRKILLGIFNGVFLDGVTPQSWSEIKMFLIHKKGDRGLPANYRSIALINNIAKITSILANRITGWAEDRGVLSECQNGFRRGRGCIDSLFILSSLIDDRLAVKGGRLFTFFVDFKNAFDRVSHGALWRKLLTLGISGRIIRVLQSFYEGAFARILVGETWTQKVPIRNGVLQGDSLSPLLFALFLNDFDDFCRSRGIMGVDVFDGFVINGIFFADDLVLVASSPVRLRGLIGVLEEYCRSNSLTVNKEKSKIMIFRRGGRCAANWKFTFEDYALEMVNEFDYLGVRFSSSGDF